MCQRLTSLSLRHSLDWGMPEVHRSLQALEAYLSHMLPGSQGQGDKTLVVASTFTLHCSYSLWQSSSPRLAAGIGRHRGIHFWARKQVTHFLIAAKNSLSVFRRAEFSRLLETDWEDVFRPYYRQWPCLLGHC